MDQTILILSCLLLILLQVFHIFEEIAGRAYELAGSLRKYLLVASLLVTLNVLFLALIVLDLRAGYILGLIGSLQIMDVPILLYGRAGLSGQIQLPIKRYMYMVYIYSQTFDFQRFGYGVALSWIFFVIVLILTLIVIVTSRYWVYYEVEQEGAAV